MFLLNSIYTGASASPSIGASSAGSCSAGSSSADSSSTDSADSADYADNYEMES